jgi:hypothetical protein
MKGSRPVVSRFCAAPLESSPLVGNIPWNLANVIRDLCKSALENGQRSNFSGLANAFRTPDFSTMLCMSCAVPAVPLWNSFKPRWLKTRSNVLDSAQRLRK